MSLPLLREEARERRLVAPFGSQLRSTNKTLPDFLLASKQIALIGEGQEPHSLSDSWLPRWGSCPLLGRGPSHQTQLPRGWQAATWTSRFSVSAFVSQPSRPLGVSGPHSRNAFPSPLSFSRSWNLSTSRLSSSPLAFPDSGCGAATASLLTASVTCSRWLPTAHLNRRQTGVGEARLMPCRPWCSRLPEGRFMRVIQV